MKALQPLRSGLIALCGALVSLCMLVPLHAGAAASAPPNGISVSPASIQLTLTTQQNNYSFNATVANNTSQPVSLSILPVDFNPDGVSGGITFAGNSAAGISNPHGLAYWLHVAPNVVGLAPHASQKLLLTLANTNTLPAGGHYTAVLFKVNPPATHNASNHVAVNQVVSMLVFTSTAGSGTRTIVADKPSVGVAWFHMPRSVDLYLSDTGNTQLTPQGYLTIYSGSRKPLSRAIMNSGSALVLPGSTRLFQTPLKTARQPLFPGRYQLEVAYTFSGSTTLYRQTVSFFYVGTLTLMIVMVILLGTLSFLIRRAVRLSHRLVFRR